MQTRRKFLAAGATLISLPSRPISVAAALPTGHAVDGSVDYSPNVQRVLDQLHEYGGGEAVLPRNTTILIGNLVTYSNIVLRGEDHTAALKVKAGCYGISLNPGKGGTPNPANNARNVAFRGFSLLGQVAVAGFAEHKHLLNLNAFTDLEVEDMLFSGFQGDGVYCGSSNTAGVERHNLRFVARRVKFDGINRNNRNAISFIDIDGALVQNCEFIRCTRDDMPGPIDMEPDANPFAVVRGVSIQHCRFRENGGGVGEVAVVVPAAVRRLPKDIRVENCSSDRYLGRGSFFYFTTNRQPSEPSSFLLRGNSVSAGGRPYLIMGARQGRIERNRFSDCRQHALLGSFAFPVREISHIDNSFVRCGSPSG